MLVRPRPRSDRIRPRPPRNPSSDARSPAASRPCAAMWSRGCRSGAARSGRRRATSSRCGTSRSASATTRAEVPASHGSTSTTSGVAEHLAEPAGVERAHRARVEHRHVAPRGGREHVVQHRPERDHRGPGPAAYDVEAAGRVRERLGVRLPDHPHVVQPGAGRPPSRSTASTSTRGAGRVDRAPRAGCPSARRRPATGGCGRRRRCRTSRRTRPARPRRPGGRSRA